VFVAHCALLLQLAVLARAHVSVTALQALDAQTDAVAAVHEPSCNPSFGIGASRPSFGSHERDANAQ
jgi:hypothetical protein